MVNTIFATREAIERHVTGADLVIGAVLVPGAAAPKLVTEEMVKAMKPGSVLVDMAIDQGGCFETSRADHARRAHLSSRHGVVHYCVANMPGAVARTSTFALNNATLPFVLALADKGCRQALADDPHLLDGLNVHAGRSLARPSPRRWARAGCPRCRRSPSPRGSEFIRTFSRWVRIPAYPRGARVPA